MRKCILTTILLSVFTACSVDNVESDLIPVSGEEVVASDQECVQDASNPVTIFGTTWFRTSFIIETQIDGDGDGIFSNDLVEEAYCSTSVLNFRDDFKATNPTYNPIALDVNDDGNGNLSQNIGCLIIDGIFPNYIQDQNIIYFCYSGVIEFTGTLSADEQTLVFNFTNEDLFFNTNTILLPNGTTEEYQGGAIITFTRQ